VSFRVRDSDAHVGLKFAQSSSRFFKKCNLAVITRIINVEENNKAYLPKKIKLMQLLKPNTEREIGRNYQLISLITHN